MKTLVSTSLVLLMSLNAVAADGTFSSPKTAYTGLTGSLQVNGEVGPRQLFGQVKAVRCTDPQPPIMAVVAPAPVSTNPAIAAKPLPAPKAQPLARNCDQPIFFDLNKAQSLPAGNYIVGFENSIYPGLVSVQAHQLTQLQLEKIPVPADLAAAPQVKVYRDLTTLIEQKKIYLSMYFEGHHFFKMTKYDFGDFYLTDDEKLDYLQRYTYDYCKKVTPNGPSHDQAKMVCAAYGYAHSMMDMADMFMFESAESSFAGTMQEMFVAPMKEIHGNAAGGDVFVVRDAKYLVSSPVRGTDFVSVFPGAYRFENMANAKAGVYQVKTADQTETYPAELLSRDFSNLAAAAGPSQAAEEESDDPAPGAQGCQNAHRWKTVNRAYCASKSDEGCEAPADSQVVPMDIELRIRCH